MVPVSTGLMYDFEPCPSLMKYWWNCCSIYVYLPLMPFFHFTNCFTTLLMQHVLINFFVVLLFLCMCLCNLVRHCFVSPSARFGNAGVCSKSRPVRTSATSSEISLRILSPVVSQKSSTRTRQGLPRSGWTNGGTSTTRWIQVSVAVYGDGGAFHLALEQDWARSKIKIAKKYKCILYI